MSGVESDPTLQALCALDRFNDSMTRCNRLLQDGGFDLFQLLHHQRCKGQGSPTLGMHCVPSKLEASCVVACSDTSTPCGSPGISFSMQQRASKGCEQEGTEGTNPSQSQRDLPATWFPPSEIAMATTAQRSFDAALHEIMIACTARAEAMAALSAMNK